MVLTRPRIKTMENWIVAKPPRGIHIRVMFRPEKFQRLFAIGAESSFGYRTLGFIVDYFISPGKIHSAGLVFYNRVVNDAAATLGKYKIGTAPSISSLETRAGTSGVREMPSGRGTNRVRANDAREPLFPSIAESGDVSFASQIRARREREREREKEGGGRPVR
jgi:hypothetical protein